MSKNKVTPKVEKKKKSVAVDVYLKTQPIRDCVSDIVLKEDVSISELLHVQGELRRLSRLVKSRRLAATETVEA